MRKKAFWRRSRSEQANLVVCGDGTKHPFSRAPLFIVDPPYGRIVGDSYDAVDPEDLEDMLFSLASHLASRALEGATCYLFGGVGSYKNRPFFGFLHRVEKVTPWRIHNFITWKKRRGYGTQSNYMFAREEIAMLVLGKKPTVFNVPYLEEKRSEEWNKRLSNKKYKPKRNNMRRSNVFVDINELFRDKICTAEKPERLIEVLIETSSNKGDLVVDPMCGSGVVGVVAKRLGRRYYLCEKDEVMYRIAKDRVEGRLLWTKSQP